ncbi:hypothetical protein HRG_009757 [Hirsutella rhossiliensis]|uniref:Integrase catalytic domain-containing protein n=1 Tax=Hirsutella rhossiliensis TaxID=111463 RepID=A0A9P8SE47_9HYPO|nr:uncharacterized protein HRG_09757 [Hirsutella rhossiliensis]KAH0959296.1 hypothetical protein HRG_09757 [Hirsutella rhossiliensis]
MAQMVIDQSTPEGRQQLAFSTMPQVHPLRDSTLLDNCASTHVVNNRDLLVDVHPASASDVVLVGDTALQVVCRGKRIMRNAFNGPGGRNTRDLVLNNVAFVPGFHTNLISGNELRALGYWSCTLDDTLRFGTMASNKIMMNMSSKAGHASPKVLDQMVPQVNGVRIQGPTTVQCIGGMMFSWTMASKTEMDNERALVNLPEQCDSEFQSWAKEEGIEIELPPSHTKEPTGGAERPGGINQQRLRSMLGELPRDLWPEAYQTAVKLHNILPSRRNQWKTPQESYLRPEWRGKYAFGCRAYPLINDYKAGISKNAFKVNPRAHVGYLVGYHSSNIYRIWVPKLRRVILSRDVTFNEHQFFDPATEDQQIAIPEFKPTIEAIELPIQRDWNAILDDFLQEFDEQILEVNPVGSISGVEGQSTAYPTRLAISMDDQMLRAEPEPAPRRDLTPEGLDTSTTAEPLRVANSGADSGSRGPPPFFADEGLDVPTTAEPEDAAQPQADSGSTNPPFPIPEGLSAED